MLPADHRDAIAPALPPLSGSSLIRPEVPGPPHPGKCPVAVTRSGNRVSAPRGEE